MGSCAEGIEKFKALKGPYARGGGTSATRQLEESCLEHLGKFTATKEAFAPYVAVAASGQAANHLVFKALHGADMVFSSHLFGTTRTDVQKTVIRSGSKVAWVDPSDTQSFIDNTTDTTIAWFVEAISNPAGRVPELEELGKAAKERGVLLIVDMTLAAGMPKFDGLKHADVLTASLTKQASGGFNSNMGGTVIVSNDFAWHEKADRFPELKEYFADASGNLALPPNPFGGLITKISLHEGNGLVTPNEALSISRHMLTMEQHVALQCENAKMLAEILSERKDVVSNVQLAGFKTDAENDARTKKYLGKNHFMLMVDLKGGFEAAAEFIDTGQFMHAVALGQQVTAVCIPASTTHRQYSKADRAKMGISEGTVRMSVGCEPRSDLAQRMSIALAL